ncbi:ABC transporter substrate-binding protein [Roseateles oligotrophus]|uniref:ABC transporter substrate-binding protein n=1 Tax=Roseateles oligotrophus TaxID=1769250 RepID=A0ABT2YC13_9BURK|nr:ABC transporter substrate-binding protein [Roseateles oligotrophus]MCV2367490.1 ABC transporter substrate-binding protein [Roseateles oligotrophus]
MTRLKTAAGLRWRFIKNMASMLKIFACVLLSGLAFGVAEAAAPETPAAEIRLGSSAALSGPAALLGGRFHAGARAAFAQANQHGGVHGSKLTVDLLDDAYEQTRAEANTSRLVDDERVLALFGYVGTPTSWAALPYVKRSRIAFVGAYTGAEILRDPANHHVFNVRASYVDESNKLAQAMQAAGVKTLNVLYQADIFGRSGLEAIKAAAAPLGLQIKAVVTVKRNTAQVANEVRALVKDGKADAVFMVSTYGTCAAFIKAARLAGYNGHFYTLSFAGREPLWEALGKSLRGVTIAQIVPDPQDSAVPVVGAYQQAMRETGEKSFDSISLEGYIAARVMVEGLLRSKPPLTREGIRAGLASLGKLDLGGFPLEYGPNTRGGSSYVELKEKP